MGEWLIFEEPGRIGGAGWSCLELFESVKAWYMQTW
jgi:hypothetical protein